MIFWSTLRTLGTLDAVRTGVSTVEIRIFDSPEVALPEWQELADRVGTVFSSRPSFVLNVVEAMGLDYELVTVFRGGRLAALAALFKVRRGPFTLAKVVGTDLGVPLEFLSEDVDASDELLAAIAARGYVLSADSLIAGDRTVERLVPHPSWGVDVVVRERVPVVELRSGQTAGSLRSTKSLKRLRQYRASADSFDIEIVGDADHLDRRWCDIARVAADAIAGTSKVNYVVSPHGEFARDFLRSEACAGRLCIAGLVIDGEWAAHEIGLRTKDRMEGWLTHYDPRVGKSQPGHQLIEWFANNHDRLGVNRLDQGIGVNRIKSTWATSGYDVLRVSAVPSAWVMSRAISRAMARVLRRLPALLLCVRKSARAAPSNER